MEKITVKIDGMMCGMCESHMNDTFRQNFKVKKVSSSHAKGETVAIVDEDIPDEKLKEAVEKTGYTFISAERKSYYQRYLHHSSKRCKRSAGRTGKEKRIFCKIQVNSYAQSRGR